MAPLSTVLIDDDENINLLNEGKVSSQAFRSAFGFHRRESGEFWRRLIHYLRHFESVQCPSYRGTASSPR
jgi:hypothetical protein